MVDKNALISEFRSQGLDAEHIVDGPDVVYRPHAHGKRVLRVLDGSIDVKLDDGDWQTVEAKDPDKPDEPARDAIEIGSGVTHEALVGKAGCEYVIAWDPQAA